MKTHDNGCFQSNQKWTSYKSLTRLQEALLKGQDFSTLWDLSRGWLSALHRHRNINFHWVLKKLLNITMFSAFAFSILDPPPSPINISPVKRDRSFQQANWSGICKRLTVSTSTPQKDWFLFEFWRNFKI